MKFAVVLPWWGYALVFCSALLLAWLAYTRVPIALTRVTRGWLTTLRAATLILLIAILLRPVVLVPPAAAHNSLVPVLVDVSRSMRLTDGDGPSRLDRAREIVRDLQARIANEYTIELLTFGEALAPGHVDQLAATARRSDLNGALADLADRHRRDRVAGVIVLSAGRRGRHATGRCAGAGRRPWQHRCGPRSRGVEPDGGRALARRRFG